MEKLYNYGLLNLYSSQYCRENRVFVNVECLYVKWHVELQKWYLEVSCMTVQ
jgi:hypothetical protein